MHPIEIVAFWLMVILMAGLAVTMVIGIVRSIKGKSKA